MCKWNFRGKHALFIRCHIPGPFLEPDAVTPTDGKNLDNELCQVIGRGLGRPPDVLLEPSFPLVSSPKSVRAYWFRAPLDASEAGDVSLSSSLGSSAQSDGS